MFLILPSARDLLIGRVGDFRDAYRQAMKEVADELNAPLVDSSKSFLEGDLKALFFDEVHPTAKGHQRIAESLLSSVIELNQPWGLTQTTQKCSLLILLKLDTFMTKAALFLWHYSVSPADPKVQAPHHPPPHKPPPRPPRKILFRKKSERTGRKYEIPVATFRTAEWTSVNSTTLWKPGTKPGATKIQK